jgi:hypothetical protein
LFKSASSTGNEIPVLDSYWLENVCFGDFRCINMSQYKMSTGHAEDDIIQRSFRVTVLKNIPVSWIHYLCTDKFIDNLFNFTIFQVMTNRLVSKNIINPNAFYTYLTAWHSNDAMAYDASQALLHPIPKQYYHEPDDHNLLSKFSFM